MYKTTPSNRSGCGCFIAHDGKGGSQITECPLHLHADVLLSACRVSIHRAEQALIQIGSTTPVVTEWLQGIIDNSKSAIIQATKEAPHAH